MSRRVPTLERPDPEKPPARADAAEWLVETIARAGYRVKSRGEQIRVVTVQDERGRYVPALVLDASAARRADAEREARRVGQVLAYVVEAAQRIRYPLDGERQW